MNKPELQRLLDLQTFLLAFRDIERVNYLPNKGDTPENDVEHSYHLAMAAWFLAQYFPHLNRDKIIRYAMAHDLVEVHAGDTYIFADDDSINTKKQREHDAFEKIKKDWKDFPDLIDAIAAYESKNDEESKFVYALDKIMPIMMNFLGKGYGEHKHKITLDVLHEHKKDKVSASPEINEYYHDLYNLLEQNLDYFPSSQQR